MALVGGEGKRGSLELGPGAKAGNADIRQSGQAEGQGKVLHKNLNQKAKGSHRLCFACTQHEPSCACFYCTRVVPQRGKMTAFYFIRL